MLINLQSIKTIEIVKNVALNNRILKFHQSIASKKIMIILS